MGRPLVSPPFAARGLPGTKTPDSGPSRWMIALKLEGIGGPKNPRVWRFPPEKKKKKRNTGLSVFVVVLFKEKAWRQAKKPEPHQSACGKWCGHVNYRSMEVKLIGLDGMDGV